MMHSNQSSRDQKGKGSTIFAFAGLTALGLMAYALARPEQAISTLQRFNKFVRNVGKDPQRILMESVRAAIDPVLTNPGAVTVQVTGHRVILKGQVLKAEWKGLLAATYGVEGVRDLSDRLEVHETSDGVPGLQGRREWDHS